MKHAIIAVLVIFIAVVTKTFWLNKTTKFFEVNDVRINAVSLLMLFCLVQLSFVIRVPLAAANSPPSLSGERVNPRWGVPGTTFTYEIIYTDADGDAPSYVRIYIDDVPYEMTYAGGSYTGGATYRWTIAATSADVGVLKTFWFEASDGMATARYPPSEGMKDSVPSVFPCLLPRNYKICMFNRQDNTPIWSYETGDWVRSVSLSSDGSYVVAVIGSGGRDERLSIHLFGRDDNIPIWSYAVDGSVLSTTITSDGSNVAAVFGGAINLFGNADNEIIQQYPVRWNHTIILSASVAGEDSNTPEYEFSGVGEGPGEMIIPGFSHFTSSSISPDGNYLVTGVRDSVYLFDRANPDTPLRTYKVPTLGYDPAGLTNDVVPSFSFDGSRIAVGFGCPLISVYMFSRETDTPLWGHGFSREPHAPPYSVSISLDGSKVVVGRDGIAEEGYNIYLFGDTDNTPIWRYFSSGIPHAVAIDNDGNRIAVGSLSDGMIRLFSDVDNNPIWSYRTGESIYSISISADGNTIAAGSRDNNVYLFDNSGEKLWGYDMGNWVSFVSVSADGNYIVAGSGNSPYALPEEEMFPEGILPAEGIPITYVVAGVVGIAAIIGMVLAFRKLAPPR